EGDGRTTHYERETAAGILARLAQPYQALEALMVAFGVEWQVIERLRARDVDLDSGTLLARGRKTRARERVCYLVAENRWLVPMIRPALSGRIGDTLLFGGISETMALRRHQ